MEHSNVRPCLSATVRPDGAESTPGNTQARRPDPDYLLLGQRVRVRLRGGQEVVGQLVGLSRYNLVIVATQGRMVVYKHAVDWLVPEPTEKGR
ncbi:MAG: hypothetical protein AB1609_19765 [Bacillota bacterium]